MVLVGDDDIARGSAAVAAIGLQLSQAGGTVHHAQTGKAVRNTVGNGLEHFGYMDGRSQPLMLLEDIEKESRDEGIAHWDPSFPLSTALVEDPMVGADELAFGSFFVFRKLEQNVRAFKHREQQLADALSFAGPARERAGAFVVGRFEDGTPVTLADTPRQLDAPHNDFDYAGDAAAARSTPTSARPTRADPAASSRNRPSGSTSWPAAASPTRTCRASSTPMAFPRRTPRPTSWRRCHRTCQPAASGCCSWPTTPGSTSSSPSRSRCGRIIRGPQAPQKPGLDGVIGQGPGGAGQPFPNAWDDAAAGTQAFDFCGFVTMKGGDYFFAPSLRFLKTL